LPEPDANQGHNEEERVAPRCKVEERLFTIWQRVLEYDNFCVTDNFFDVGGDSLQAVALVVEVNKDFGTDLALATILQAATIEQMALLLEGPRPPAIRGSLVPLESEGRQSPFFCVHTVGGIALRYRALALELGADRPFYAIEAHGVDGRQLPDSTVEAMAARYVHEITALEPVGPYYLGGYCSGGIVAYEMAQQLLAAGYEVAQLLLIDTCHPRLWEDPGARLRLYRAIKRWIRVAVHHACQAAGRRAPARLTERLVNEYLRRAFMDYRPRPYSGRATMIRSTTHPYGEYQMLGWESLLPEDTRVVVVPGDHTQMLDDAQVRRHVAAAMRATLADSLGRAA
jgi:thioesterase domain-containing protein/acyl carrier protein